jgi:hypothetical protein
MNKAVSSIPTPIPIPTLIPIPTPIAVPNESAGDTQAKNLFSLFLHHRLGLCSIVDQWQLYLLPTLGFASQRFLTLPEGKSA